MNLFKITGPKVQNKKPGIMGWPGAQDLLAFINGCKPADQITIFSTIKDISDKGCQVCMRFCFLKVYVL